MYMSQERYKDLKIAIERETEPLKKRIEALEAAVPRRSIGPLTALAGLFAESVHETWTKDEIVGVINDAIRIAYPVSRPIHNTQGK
jgi:hypothetical protein